MRTRFYREFPDTEDDGGGLQRELISRCWIGRAKFAGFPLQSLGHY